MAALGNLLQQAQERLDRTLRQHKAEEEQEEAQSMQDRSKTMFERLASSKERELAAEAAAKEARLTNMAREQRLALEKVVADRERLLREKEEEMVKREAEHKRRLHVRGLCVCVCCVCMCVCANMYDMYVCVLGGYCWVRNAAAARSTLILLLPARGMRSCQEGSAGCSSRQVRPRRSMIMYIYIISYKMCA